MTVDINEAERVASELRRLAGWNLRRSMKYTDDAKAALQAGFDESVYIDLAAYHGDSDDWMRRAATLIDALLKERDEARGQLAQAEAKLADAFDEGVRAWGETMVPILTCKNPYREGGKQ